MYQWFVQFLVQTRTASLGQRERLFPSQMVGPLHQGKK